MILATVLLVFLWGVVAARLPTLWRDQRQRALWAAVCALAISRTMVVPPFAGQPGAPAAQHLTAVLAATFLLRFVLLVTGGIGGRADRAAIGVVLALTVGAAAACLLDPGLLTGDLTPAAVAYWTVLDLYLGVVLAVAAALFWTTGADAPARVPRIGLRVFAAGAGLLALDAVARAAIMVALGFDPDLDLTRINPVAELGQAVTVLLMVTGGVAISYPRARAALAAYRSLLALRPLWTAMRDAFPAIILFSPRRALIELAGVDDVHLRLYRRVIEIRDGMLALRDHLPADHAGGGDPAEAEARGILLALQARAAGVAPAGPAGSWAPVGPQMTDEVAWLRRVSRACRRLRGTVVTEPGARTPRPSGSAR